jgi:hypothetical protein
MCQIWWSGRPCDRTPSPSPFAWKLLIKKVFHCVGISFLNHLNPMQSYCLITASFPSQYWTCFQQLLMPRHYAMSLRWILSIFLPEFSLHSHQKFKFCKPITTLHFLLHREPHFTYLCSTDNNTYVRTIINTNAVNCNWNTLNTFKHFQQQACLLWEIVSKHVDKCYTHSCPA